MKSTVQAVALTALAAGAIAVSATAPASAAGTSTSHYNCYTQWWNTAWAQKCAAGGADVVGWYESTVSCSSQPDKYLDKYRLAGNATTYSGVDCSFSVSNGQLSYLGY